MALGPRRPGQKHDPRFKESEDKGAASLIPDATDQRAQSQGVKNDKITGMGSFKNPCIDKGRGVR